MSDIVYSAGTLENVEINYQKPSKMEKVKTFVDKYIVYILGGIAVCVGVVGYLAFKKK